VESPNVHIEYVQLIRRFVPCGREIGVPSRAEKVKRRTPQRRRN
jgi:hypothetical protein